LRYQAHTATGELYDVFELRKRADGTNELVEGEQLDYEAARWLRFGGLTRGQSAWAAAALFGLAGLLLARRWLRRRVRAA
jgi:hypothetical protein